MPALLIYNKPRLPFLAFCTCIITLQVRPNNYRYIPFAGIMIISYNSLNRYYNNLIHCSDKFVYQ